jgi:hypothetical protein
LSYLAKPDGYNLQNIEGFYTLKEDSLDVIYVGGSAAFVYFAPVQAWDEYGIVSYDFAADTMQLELYELMIKEILKTQNPQLIILDARPFQYRAGIDSQPPGEVPYRNTLTGMPLDRNKADFINRYVKQFDADTLSYYFDLLKFHENITNFTDNNVQMMLGNYRSPYCGFYFVPDVCPFEQPDAATGESRSLSAETETIFNDLLDYLDSTGIDYLFTVSPYMEKKEHKMIFNYVERKITERGYGFIDCNDYIGEIGIDYSCELYNENHVNIFGAEKYTDFMCRYIIENYNVPNRKDDPEYAYMNDYVDDWYTEVDKTKSEILSLIEEQDYE